MKANEMIGIRVDVNKHIATGHITRTIAIAEHIVRKGGDCIFISSDGDCATYLEKKGFKYVVLNSDWDKKEEELGKLIAVLEEYKITTLLIDSYQVTERYFETLSRKTKIYYFDELYIKGYNKCVGLINGLLLPPDYKEYAGKVFKGPQYVPLRAEFFNAPKKKIRDKANSILLTSGGGDEFHFLRTLLEEFLEDNRFLDYSINVAVGGYYPIQDVEEFVDNPRVFLYVNTDKMMELIVDSDIAITAGGMTIYEVCSCGTPGIVFSMADNQIEQCRAFDCLGLIKYAGDIRGNVKEVVSNILAGIDEMKDAKMRKDISEKMQKCVDGRGAERIADILMGRY